MISNNDNNNKSPLLPLPVVQKYKAYRTGRLDLRRDIYDYCDLFDMHTVRYPLYKKNFEWQREHPNEKPVLVVGSEKRIAQLQGAQYYSSSSFSSSSSSSPPESGTDSYTVIIARLYARRYYNVPKFELEQWDDEGRQEEGTILIEQPIPGIAICREILERSGEEPLCHPVIAASNPEMEGKSDYTISYDPVNCSHPDCSKCFGEIEPLKEPQLFILGLPRYHPDVLKIDKDRAQRRKKVRQLKIWRDMTAILSASIEMTLGLSDMDGMEYEDAADVDGAAGGADHDDGDDGKKEGEEKRKKERDSVS